MAHTNSTTNYNLPQFVGTDKPTWLGDVNGAMTAIDTAIAGVAVTASGADSKADSAITTANAASGTASDAATLANTANTNANSALTTAGNAATAASAAQSTASAASTKADTADGKADANALKIGDLTALTTTAKTDLVAAINEVDAKPSGGGTAADITYDNTTSGLTAATVQAAIDELAAGLNPPLFAWAGSTKTWTNGLTLAPTAGQSLPSTCAVGEVLPAGCKMYVEGTISSNSTDSDASVAIRPVGSSTWIESVVKYQPTTQGTEHFTATVDLSTYAGQSLEIKASAYNHSTTCNVTFTRIDITNAPTT